MTYSVSKIAKKCDECPKKDKCEHKRMELCAAAELPITAPSSNEKCLDSATVPLLRERIESPLSPFAYRDELEKELYKALSVNHKICGF